MEYLFWSVGFRKVFAGEGFEFAADDVGGKACGEEGAVDRGEFLVVNFLFHFGVCKYKPRTAAPKRAEFAFYALTDDGSFVFGVGGIRQCLVDMAIGDAAGTEVASDAEFALFADFGALAGELFGVARVVELAGFPEAGENDLSEKFGIGATEEFRFHFVDRMRAAHQDAEGVFVQVLFGVEFAGLREHGRRVKEGRNEVKRGNDCSFERGGSRV